MFCFLSSCYSKGTVNRGDTTTPTSSSVEIPSAESDRIGAEAVSGTTNGDARDIPGNSVANSDTHFIDSVFTLKYGLVDVDIRFPQLDGLNDEILEDTINELIYNSAITQAEMQWSKFRYEVSITFSIKYLSNKYVSIVFSDDINDSRYNSYREALTIDLKTGKKVSLSEFYSGDEVLKLINSLMFTENCRIADEFWSYWPDAKILIKGYCITQFSEMENPSWENGFYLCDDKLGLIISVTAPEHASVEFEIASIPWQ